MARRGDDDAPWLAEGVREERSTLVPRARLVGGGLLAVLLAVLVAVGVYLAAGKKADGSQGYAKAEDAPLIAADAGPYKVPPTDPGGAQVGGVTDTLAAAGAGDDTGSAIDVTDTEEPLARPGSAPTDLLPATIPPAVAPVPMTRPLPPAMPPGRPVPAPAAAAPPPVPAAKTPPPARSDSAPSAKPIAKPDVVKAARLAPKPATTDAPISPAHDAAKPVDVLPPAGDPLATAPAKRKPDPLPVPDAPAKPKPTVAATDAPKPSGRTTLQLGAFSSPEKAEAAWARAGGDGALSGLTRRIEPVEHDGKTLYRLRAGGVAPNAAAALCARLQAAGAACIVAK